MILLLVMALVASRALAFGEEVLLAHIYGATSPSMGRAEYWMFLRTATSSLVNIAAALWIYVEARAAGVRAWIWALLGLFFGPIGLAIAFAAMYCISRQAPGKQAGET
jgi:hypothetical protein